MNASSSPSAGRGMTWLPTSSPTCWAAWAPASTAARTLPTSPCTIVVTKAPPIPTRLTICTLAAFAIASVASTRPTSPLVSINPIADIAVILELFGSKCLVLGISASLALAALFQIRRQHDAEVVVWEWNDLHADDLADSPSGCGAGVGRAFHRGHIARDKRRDEPAAHLVPADKLDIGRLEHRIGRFEQGNEALRFNHSQCFVRFGHNVLQK